MGDRNFQEMRDARWAENKFVCLGLDPVVEKLPNHLQPKHTDYASEATSWRFMQFCDRIVASTHDLVFAYKPNIARFEHYGNEGWEALRKVIKRTHEIAPGVPVILDAKRGDIEESNTGYVHAAFEHFGADAVTVSPYLGGEALEPFLARAGKGIFVLCRTSNKGAGEFQDLTVHANVIAGSYLKLYEYVAVRVASYWNKSGNCGLVVGATYPEELRRVRELVGDMPALITAVGAQGGNIEKAVRAGMDSRGAGMIINSSSGIIFASSGEDFADAARRETQRLDDTVRHIRADAIG